MSTTSSSSHEFSDSEADDYKTPPKRKKRYKRAIHFGFSKRKARYHGALEEQTTNSEVYTATSSATRGTSCEEGERSPKDMDTVISYSDRSFSNNSVSTKNTDNSPSSASSSDLDDLTSMSSSSVFDDSTSSNGHYSDQDILSDLSDTETTDTNFNLPLFEGCKLSEKQSYTLTMLFALKYKLPKSGFSHLLKLIGAHLPETCNYSTSVYKVKENLKRIVKFEEPQVHKYCEKCQRLLREDNTCNNEACITQSAAVHEFFDLNMKDQLKNMFKDSQFIDAMKNQQNRINGLIDEGVITDIAQGEVYKRTMQQPNDADVNLTFTMNTDGVALFTSSKKGSLWPVYIAINELPIKLRFSRKYLIPCYLHCQTEKPNMLTYLTPMMEMLNMLCETGFYVTDPNGINLLVKAKVIAVSVDLPARAMVSNMKQFNGKFGCSFCLDEGKSPPGQAMLRFYPYQNTSIERTHQSMITDARDAVRSGVAIHGIKGVSALMMLNYIDLPKVLVIDWMHSVLLGVTKAMMILWFNSKNKDKHFFIGNKIELLNQRFLAIKIPAFISRRQRSLHDHSHWKASEYKEWLIHFSTPVLYDVMDPNVYTHYLVLVTALSILTQDKLVPENVDLAENLLIDFCKIFPTIYGEQKQTMNIHMLKHLASFVKLYGPLYGFSCFGFESMNSYLKSMVHGTRHVNKQVSFAVGMSKHLGNLVKEITNSVDPHTRQLTFELSSSLVQDEKITDGTCVALGKKFIVSEGNEFYNLLSPELIENNPKMFPRLKVSDVTYYSKRYQNAKTRNDSAVHFSWNQEKLYGTILTFIETRQSKFAVIQQHNVEPFTLSNDMIRSITDQNLRNYRRELCPHILKSTDVGEKLLIPVHNLGKKCVFIEIGQYKYFSCPPNLLEHN